MKLVSLENLSKYNELLSQKTVRSVNSVKPDSNGNVKLGTEKSTFNKVVYDTGYFSIGTNATYNFDLTGTDIENVSKDNVNIRLVAKVVTAHNGFEVGDIAQLSTVVDANAQYGVLGVCAYIRGNTLYLRSGTRDLFSIETADNVALAKSNVQIKAVLTAFVPDDGRILLIAEDQTNTSKLIGLPDGTLTWGGKTIASVTGEIKWFAFNEAPDGYLVCNGAEVSRETYADLFAKIGTTFGEGDGSTTFALPNLIDKFAQGSTTVGTVKSAGLPNITGFVEKLWVSSMKMSGSLSLSNYEVSDKGTYGNNSTCKLTINAHNSNSIYGNSTTVQPPALTLLPCIKY